MVEARDVCMSRVEACVRHGRELKCSGCGVTLGLGDADDVARAMREVRPDLLCSVLTIRLSSAAPRHTGKVLSASGSHSAYLEFTHTRVICCAEAREADLRLVCILSR